MRITRHNKILPGKKQKIKIKEMKIKDEMKAKENKEHKFIKLRQKL